VIRNSARFVLVFLVPAVLFEMGLHYAVADSTLIKAVNTGSDKQVHIVHDDGREEIIPKEKNQVDCTATKIAEDGRTAGWLIQSENCCTSYPIPLTLVIYRDGEIIRRFAPGQSIWDWRFLKGGSQVAFWIGPMHGDFTPHFELHGVVSGRMVAEWDGHVDEKHPDWVSGLKE
jgi:hypothetical protein